MTSNADPEIPDPLLEDFQQLERKVGARRMAEFRASCPHDGTITLATMGEPDREICTRCGTVLE